MRHVAQAPSHYEVELPPADRQNGRTGAAWKPVKRVGPDGAMSPLTFGSLGAAQAYARRMSRREARIVAVEHGGWRRTVGAAGA